MTVLYCAWDITMMLQPNIPGDSKEANKKYFVINPNTVAMK